MRACSMVRTFWLSAALALALAVLPAPSAQAACATTYPFDPNCPLPSAGLNAAILKAGGGAQTTNGIAYFDGAKIATGAGLTWNGTTVGGTYTLGGALTIASPIFTGSASGTYTLGGTPTIASPVFTGTASGTYTLGGTPTITGLVSINKLAITAPATSATLTIANGKTLTANNSLTFSGTDSTTLTFPSTSKTIAANDLSNVTLSGDCTNSSAAVTCTKTNGSSFTSLATAAVGQIPGTTTNDDASAGNVGENSRTTATGVSLTNNTTANIVTSPSLGAGDWNCYGAVSFNPAGTTTVSVVLAATNTTSATLPTDPDESFAGFVATFSTGVRQRVAVPPKRYTFTTPSTVKLVAQSSFATSTMTADGALVCRRPR